MWEVEKKSMRDVFGECLIEFSQHYPDMVVLDADLSGSTKSKDFGRKFPERFFNIGVAEQNMMGIAAGLASAGMMPVVCSFGVFLSMRALEQFRQSVAYTRLNVKVMGHYGGISDSHNGPTHQTTEDLGIIRSLPNSVLLVPSDGREVRGVLKSAFDYNGPVYIRFCRNPVIEVSGKHDEFTIGKGYEVLPGNDVTVIAIGIMVGRSVLAALKLREETISCRVLSMPSLKPIDRVLITRAARETGAIVTAEEHNIYGGLGSAVAEVLVEESPVPMERVGIQDTFAESGTYEGLLEKYGLAVSNVVEAARRAIKRKLACP
jgi:transketolase